MKRSYWENLAADYHDEIFDVLQNDEKALIRSVIEKHASSKKTVIDIGCAIGKWIPLLSPLFKKVVAIDISKKNLAIAEKLHEKFKNIEYRRVDMSSKTLAVQPCDLGICINAILTPSAKDRDRFFAALPACIKKGGILVMTIPSLESWLLSSIIQKRYKIDHKLFPRVKSPKKAFENWENILTGNAAIDGVPHKHYLEEELRLLLSEAKFKIEEISKIEYNWDTEFNKPPSWLKNPRPWDWMVVAKKL